MYVLVAESVPSFLKPMATSMRSKPVRALQAHEVLLAGEHQLHGLLGLERQRDADGLGAERAPLTEAAADERRQQLDLAHGHLEDVGQLAAGEMGQLRLRPHVQAAAGVDVGDAGGSLLGAVLLLGRPERALHHKVGVAEGLVGIALGERVLEVLGDVARSDSR